MRRGPSFFMPFLNVIKGVRVNLRTLVVYEKQKRAKALWRKRYTLK